MGLSEKEINNNFAKLKPLSAEKLKQLQDIELNAIASFSGQMDELETALGFLRMGFHFGWKPLALVHSKKTFRKYEEILGIEARALFPEETPSSERHKAYMLTKQLSNFWKAVSGDVKVDRKREID